MRTVARLACLLALALPAVALPAVVHAARTGRPLRALSAAGLFAQSDGERWGVFTTSTGMTVVDGATSTLRATSVGLAGPCGSQFGIPYAIGGGFIAVQCTYSGIPGAPVVLVYDIAARAFHRVPNDTALTHSMGGFFIDGIGATWLAFRLEDHTAIGPEQLIDWHDGRIVPATTSAHEAIALDAASGAEPLCAGLTRPRSRNRLFRQRGRFALTQTGPVSSPHLVLRRCGGRTVTLSRRREAPETAQLGTRTVTWQAGKSVFARDLRTARTMRWRVPPGARSSIVPVIAGRHLLVTRASRTCCGFTVFSTRVG